MNLYQGMKGLHCDFACHLYTKHLINRLPEDTVVEIIKDAVNLEKEFVTDALPVKINWYEFRFNVSVY